MIDLISRQAAIDAAEKIIERDTSGGNIVVNAMIAWAEYIKGLSSVEPSWDIVKMMLRELEQKEERLYSDYCDATARLKAINKIAESDQKPNQKIDGIKPLAELEVEE